MTCFSERSHGKKEMLFSCWLFSAATLWYAPYPPRSPGSTAPPTAARSRSLPQHALPPLPAAAPQRRHPQLAANCLETCRAQSAKDEKKQFEKSECGVPVCLRVGSCLASAPRTDPRCAARPCRAQSGGPPWPRRGTSRGSSLQDPCSPLSLFRLGPHRPSMVRVRACDAG